MNDWISKWISKKRKKRKINFDHNNSDETHRPANKNTGEEEHDIPVLPALIFVIETHSKLTGGLNGY